MVLANKSSLSGSMVSLGECTLATRGQRPPNITPLTRLVFPLQLLGSGVDGVESRGIKPISAKDETKSCRRKVTSLTVVKDIKFWAIFSNTSQYEVWPHVLLRRMILPHYEIYLRYAFLSICGRQTHQSTDHYSLRRNAPVR